MSEVEGFVPWTWWPHQDAGHTDEAKKEVYEVLGKGSLFDTPKPTRLIERMAFIATRRGDFVVDFFAGTGTRAHAVMKLNRDDGERRRFVLVEMAEYFTDALLPRIQKIMYAPEWEDGKPKRQPTSEEVERTPRLVKVLRLEGYEDALHNLVTDRTLARAAVRSAGYRARVGEDAYRLRYVAKLPMEASASLLDLAALEHPFDYRLEVLTEDGPREAKVDLVETFNWLYGVDVERAGQWQNPEDDRVYRFVKGTVRDGRRVLVLWRDLAGLDPVRERRFLEKKIAEESRFEETWINGDTAASGFRSLDAIFKRLLEEGDR